MNTTATVVHMEEDLVTESDGKEVRRDKVTLSLENAEGCVFGMPLVMRLNVEAHVGDQFEVTIEKVSTMHPYPSAKR